MTTGDKQSLGTWVTPVEPMPRLAAALGLGADDLWIKRDDLFGLGGGGNKVRKLERTVAGVLRDGADHLVTSGAPQSNHARLTAAAGARLGLPVTLVLEGEPPAAERGNLVLDRMLGATIVWAGEVGPDGLDAVVEQRMDAIRAGGEHPGRIPFGGSNAAGAAAYRDAGLELAEQRPDLDTVVVAVGSGGTMAGLVAALGARAVVGIDTGAVPDAVRRVLELWHEIEPDRGGGRADLQVRGDFVGRGYGTLTEQTREAMQLVARTEGIILDPVYTGRAAAGLVGGVRDGTIRAGRTTVLLHSGGLPGLFGHPDVSPWPQPADGT